MKRFEDITSPEELAAELRANGSGATISGCLTKAAEKAVLLDKDSSDKKSSEPEASFQSRLIKFLREHGWKVCEFRKARRIVKGQETWRTPFGADGKGFPDLFAVRPPRVAIIEDKSNRGEVPPDQVNWLMLLARCPQLEVRVLRPDDWPEIEEMFG